MRKFLLIIFLAISVTLFGCSSKDNEEVGNIETEEESRITGSEEIETGKEDEGELETSEADEDLKKESQDNDLQEAEDNEDQGEGQDPEEKQEAEEAEDKKGEEQLKETEKKIEKEVSEKIEGDSKGEPEKPIEESPSKAESEKESPTEEKVNGLHIQGKVGKPISLNLDDLKAMNDIIFKGSFYSLNNFGTTAHTEFKGVNLWSLLNSKAEILDDASKIRIIATDGYEMNFTVAEVKRQDYIDETDDSVKLPMIIAWEENGEEYDLDDGLPFKLVIGQKEAGDINKPQWVSNIEKIVVE